MTDKNRETTTDRFGPLKIAVAILVVFLLHGCGMKGVLPPPAEQQYPHKRPVDEAPVVDSQWQGPAKALYKEARASMSQGNNQKAELAIERALRIEPGNAYYWYTMGKIKYRQGAYFEAIQFCKKSKSLAGRNPKLLQLNDALIAKSKKDLGS